LSSTLSSTHFRLNPLNNQRLLGLCGPCNENLDQIAKFFEVSISQRSNAFKIVGSHRSVLAAENALQQLYLETQSNEILTSDKIHLELIQKTTKKHSKETPPMETVIIKTKHATVKARNPHQENYIKNIRKYDINFSIGPAGTGKTFLAVACAVEAFERGDVQRLVFVRPAVEAGEKLGFLPGDLQEKILPYLRPIYDSLYEMLGFEQANKLIEKDVIEIAPLAFMRGRTLSDAFIILDEGQNTTVQQMKMFLTRIGFGSTAVVTGDITQIDLPQHEHSGLKDAIEIVKDIENISINFFNANDAVRHPLVTAIIDAYDNNDEEAS